MRKMRIFGLAWLAMAASSTSFAALKCEDRYADAFAKIAAQKAVRPEILLETRKYLGCASESFVNKDYVSIVDYKLHSRKKRFHLIDLKNNKVTSYLTAHGRGSDPDHTGYAKKFSDVNMSKASSLGFYRTAEIYYGGHGKTLALDGLSPTNKNARARKVVIHGAPYVDESRDKMGRSWGCPSLRLIDLDSVVDAIKGGSLLAVFK